MPKILLDNDIVRGNPNTVPAWDPQEPLDNYNKRKVKYVAEDYDFDETGTDRKDVTHDIQFLDTYEQYPHLDLDLYKARRLMKFERNANAGTGMTAPNWDSWVGAEAEACKAILVKHCLVWYPIRKAWLLAEETGRTEAEVEEIDRSNWIAMVIGTQGYPIHLYKGRSLVAENMREIVSDWVRVFDGVGGGMSLSDAYDMEESLEVYKQAFIHSGDTRFRDWIANEGVYSDTGSGGFREKTYYSDGLRDALITEMDRLLPEVGL